jgi:hypothetical protein
VDVELIFLLFKPIFQMSAQQQFINAVTPEQFDNLKVKYTAQGDDRVGIQ